MTSTPSHTDSERLSKLEREFFTLFDRLELKRQEVQDLFDQCQAKRNEIAELKKDSGNRKRARGDSDSETDGNDARKRSAIDDKESDTETDGEAPTAAPVQNVPAPIVNHHHQNYFITPAPNALTGLAQQMQRNSVPLPRGLGANMYNSALNHGLSTNNTLARTTGGQQPQQWGISNYNRTANNTADSRPATVAPKLRKVKDLWNEWAHGLEGRKPASQLTALERKAPGNKERYYDRMPIYKVLAGLVRAGKTPEEAIEMVEQAYPRCGMRKLGIRIRQDERNGTLPELLRVLFFYLNDDEDDPDLNFGISQRPSKARHRREH